MATNNVQRISPDRSSAATHHIDCSTAQRTLGLGPLGLVDKPKIPDNTAFWAAVNAVEFSSRGVTRQTVYRTVAYYVSLTEKRICFAAVETQAKWARLGTTAYRAHLRALERDGYIETEGDRSRGRSTTCYRLANPTLSVANPTLSDINPTLSVAKEVIEKGTEVEVQQRTYDESHASPQGLVKTGKSKLTSSPHSAQQRLVCALAAKLGLPAMLNAGSLEAFDYASNAEKQVFIRRLLRVEARFDSRAAKTHQAQRRTRSGTAPSAANSWILV